MRVAIIGAGLTGLSSALALVSAGHDVQVFDRHSGVAAGASFAAGGILAPFPPSRPDPDTWSWAGLRETVRHWRLRKQVGALDRRAQDQALADLMACSARGLEELTRSFRQEPELRQGWMMLASERQDATFLDATRQRLQALAIPHEWLDAEQARDREPGLWLERPIQATLYLPQVQVANLRQLAQQMRLQAETAGARIHCQAEVLAVTPGQPASLTWLHRTDTNPGRPATVRKDPPSASPTQAWFDAVIFAGGADGLHLLSGMALDFPWQVRLGCTLTALLHQPEAAPDPGPRGAVSDLGLNVSISRLGDRVRMSRMGSHVSEIGPVRPKDLAALHAAMDRWFPSARYSVQSQAWQATCLTLPDGAPVIGPSGLAGIWLNLGHGEWGASMAWGAAKVLTDLLDNPTTNLDSAPWHPGRWR